MTSISRRRRRQRARPARLATTSIPSLDHQPVVRRQHALWQPARPVGVVDLVVHVGEIAPRRPDAVDPAQGHLEVGVARVRAVAERVDDPDVEALEAVQRLVREAVGVGRVGEAADAEAPALAAAVLLAEGDDLDVADPERALDRGGVDLGAPEAGLAGTALEGVGEARGNALEDRRVREGRDRRHDDVVDLAQVVDAVDVVGVGVGVEERVDGADAGVQALLPQVGAGVDQDAPALRLDQDRAAAALVARVGRAADGAGAADLRHAGRGAAAEDRDSHAAARLPAALVNRRKKLSVVARSISATVSPHTSASVRATWAVKAGSLVLPRIGTGARYGASVSSSSRS